VSLYEMMLAKRGNRVEGYNMSLRRRIHGLVESINLVLPGENLTESRVQNNVFNVAPGDHGGSTLTKADTEIRSVGAGAVIKRPTVCSGDAIMDGVTFSTGTDTGPSVSVNSPAVVLFRGCVFEKPGDDVDSHVYVEEGAKATFVGCVFRGSGTTAAPVVSHTVAGVGVITDVQIAFSYNKTGNTLFTAGTATATGNH
jgi:hypothetical protein